MILIRHWNLDEPVIRKIKIKNEKFEEENIYYLGFNKEIIKNGINDIQLLLNTKNDNSKEDNEDYFYEIDINMKIVHDLKKGDDVKEKICFIYYPELIEQKNLGIQIMKNCKAFLFLFNNKTIKDINNIKSLNNFFSVLRDINMPINDFIKTTLFIVDENKNENISKIDYLKAKNDLEEISMDFKNNREFLNICVINIQYFLSYLKKIMYYENIDFMVQFEYDNYLDYLELNENISKQMYNINDGFRKYFLEILKQRINNDFNENFNKDSIKNNPIIEKKIKNIFESDIFQIRNEEELKSIIELIYFGNECLNNLYDKSNIEFFFSQSIIRILNSENAEKEFLKNNECFNILDETFEYDKITKKYGIKKDRPVLSDIYQKYLYSIEDKKRDTINKIMNYDLMTKFKDCLKTINSHLNNYENIINKNNTEKDIQDFFKDKFNNLYFDSLIKEEFNKIKEQIDSFYILLNSIKLELKLVDVDCGKNEISFEKYIEKRFNNNINKVLENLKQEIVEESKNANNLENSDTFLNYLICWLFDNKEYLRRIIKYIKKICKDKFDNFTKNFLEAREEFSSKCRKELENSSKYIIKELKKKNEIENNNYNNEKKIWEQEEKIWKYWEEKSNDYRDIKRKIYKL